MSHLITRIISAITPIYDPVIDIFLGGEGRVRARFMERVAPFERGLDIGCGTGSFAAMLVAAEKGDVAGIDVSARMVGYARKRHPEIECRVGNALSLPFDSGTFDAVFSTMMMHHLTDGEKLQAIKEIRRVLGPGGTYYSLEFGRTGLTLTGRAVTSLGFLEDSHLSGFDITAKELWEKGLVWREAKHFIKRIF